MQTLTDRQLEPCGILMLSLSGALYHFALPSATLLWVKNLTADGDNLVNCQELTKFNAEAQHENAQSCEECNIMSSKNWLICVNSEHKNETDNITKQENESSYHEEEEYEQEEEEQEEESQIYKSPVRLQNVEERCNCTITMNWRCDKQTSVDSHVDNHHSSLHVHELSIEESVQRWNAEHVTQEPVRLLGSKEQEYYELHLESGKEKTYYNSSGTCRTSCEEGSSKERSVNDSQTTFLQIMWTTYRHNLFRRDIITGKHDALRFRSTKVEISIEQPTFEFSKRRETNLRYCTYHEQECETNYTNVNTKKSKTLLGSSVNVSNIICTSHGALYDNNKQIMAPLVNASHDCVVWCALVLQSFKKVNIVKNSDLNEDQMTTTDAVYSLRVVPVHASCSPVALCNKLTARHVNANTWTKCNDSIILINQNKQESQNEITDVIEKQNVLRIVIDERKDKYKTEMSMHDTSDDQEIADYSKEESTEFYSKSEEEQEEEQQESLKEEEEESKGQETLESPLYELPSMSGRTFSGTDQRSSELNNTPNNKSSSDTNSKTIKSSGGGSPWAVVSPHLVTEETVASFFDDNFEPIQVLGKGASGAALLVRHHATGFLYAIKVFIARDYESERHILQETRLHAFLQHRHLVRYHVSWSEVVTRKRAQELAQIGLCHPEEAEVLPIRYAPEELSSLSERSSFQSNTDNTKSEHTNYKVELNGRPHHKSIIGSRVIFLQMELCQRTLKSYLEERSNVDRVENMVIFLQIVSGIRYMHRMHLVHRDIKANNIFLDYRCQLAPANTLRADDESDDDDNITTVIGSNNNNDTKAEFYDKENNEKEEPALTVQENWTLTTFCIAHEAANQPRWQIGPPLMPYGCHCVQLSTRAPFTHIATLNNNNNTRNSYKNGGNNNVTVINHTENSELEVENDNDTTNEDSTNNNTLLDACDNIHHCSANDVIREAILMYAVPHSHSNINKTNQRTVSHDSRNGGAANNDINSYSNDAVSEKNITPNKLSLDESKWSRVLRWVQRRLVQVRIGDFGLSKFLNYSQHSVLQSDKIENCESDSSESSDSVNHVNTKGVGTPLYASPEQLAGMMCTSASDVFSLGVLFTEMYIEPTTQSERIVLLQRVRQGTFPDSAMLARYPELGIVPQLTRLCPQERMTLDKVHIILYNILLECIKVQVHDGVM